MFCIIFYQNQSYDLFRISCNSLTDQMIQLSRRDGKEWKPISGTMHLHVILFSIDSANTIKTDRESIPLLTMLAPSSNPFTLFAVDVFNKIWKVVLDLTSLSNLLCFQLLYAHQQWKIQTILPFSSNSKNDDEKEEEDSSLLVSCKNGMILNLSMNGAILQEMHLPPGRIGYHFLDKTIDIPDRLVIDNEGDVYRLTESGIFHELRGCHSLSLPSCLQSSFLYLQDDILYVKLMRNDHQNE